MKIKVSAIRPNPFRNIEHYPISRDKVEALKESINRTEFWENIIVRPEGDGYQMAFGHHRLQALKEMGISEVDIPVKNLTDEMMLLMMAKENMDNWQHSPSVVTETVIETKKYLDGLLAKCATFEEWEAYPLSGEGICLIEDNRNFNVLKANGAGSETISKFLGGGYSAKMCETALTLHNSVVEEVVAPEAIREFKNISAASNFVRAVKKQKIEPEEQIEIAKELNADGGASKREVKKHMDALDSKRDREESEAFANSMGISKGDPVAKRMASLIMDCDRSIRDASSSVWTLLDFMRKHGINEAKGPETMKFMVSFNDLIKAVTKLTGEEV